MAAMGPTSRSADVPPYGERWVYVATNLLVDENVPKVLDLMERASKAGYTAIQLNDYKLSFLERMPERYFANVKKVRDAAERLKLEIIPSAFPIGYSGGLLSHDANLAEGLPAESVVVVRGGKGTVEGAAEQRLKNGALEDTRSGRDHQFDGFSFQDDPGVATFADQEVHRPGGKISCRIDAGAKGRPSDSNARLIQRVEVRPRGCYRLSGWVKTREFGPTGSFRLLAIGDGEGGRPLSFHEGGLESTQDWKPIEVVFNSLDRTAVNIYAGVWGPGEGSLWLDDLKLEEVPLTNLLRRPGCPLVVASEDGSRVYEEGRDFEPLIDPSLGQVPWAGEFEFGHEAPILKLKAGSRIREGARLKISWYHPVITHGFQVACCLSEPKVYEILEDQAKRIVELFHPKTLFMSHDELRVANWCRACADRKLTPGQLLADNARRCVDIVRKIDPKLRVAIWSDMFDPHHNAVDGYYLVNGTLAGSWEGLPKEVVIANWNSGKAAESLKFFADRGNPQVIAGYYDVGNMSNFDAWKTSAQGVPGVVGFMYTTWSQDYRLLEDYGRASSVR